MTQQIDVQTVLQETVCELYTNLVTRATGKAVRMGIERALLDPAPTTRRTTVIDFSQVGLVDHSCADEIVAKLMLESECAQSCTFLFKGLSESHLEAVEPVLERHELPILVEGPDGELDVIGPIRTTLRQAFDAVNGGAPDLFAVARRAGLSVEDAADAMDELMRLRLLPPEHRV